LIPRLPLMRTALVAIAAVYLLRGLVLVPALALNGGKASPFLWWSSLIVLGYGIVYAVGTLRAWPTLAGGAR
jgi:Na+/melibiose symporter-like transporter